jgi:hypothetical protein
MSFGFALPTTTMEETMPEFELSIPVEDIFTGSDALVAAAFRIPIDEVPVMRKALSEHMSPRPEAIDRSLRTKQDIEFWSTRTAERQEVLTRISDVSDNLERLVQATCGGGVYLLADFPRDWAKWGYTGDLDAELNGARLEHHRRKGWDVICACPGMSQQGDEKRIRAALTRKGFEKFPGTNEVFRLSRELITEAIGLGAPLPDNPFSLLNPPQLELF